MKKSLLDQPQFDDGIGVFANRDFKVGDLVITWKLKTITGEQWAKLPERERRQFTHKREGTILYYPDPERHVNRSKNPNVFPDFDRGADVAIRNIARGEEITISDTVKEDS